MDPQGTAEFGHFKYCWETYSQSGSPKLFSNAAPENYSPKLHILCVFFHPCFRVSVWENKDSCVFTSHDIHIQWCVSISHDIPWYLHVLHHHQHGHQDKELKTQQGKIEKLEERYVKVVRFNKILMEVGCLGWCPSEGPVKRKRWRWKRGPKNSLVNSHVHKNRRHTAFAGPDTGMDLFIDECNRFSPRKILPGYFWE